MHTIEKNTELKIIWFDGSSHQNCVEENDRGQWHRTKEVMLQRNMYGAREHRKS